MFRSYPIEDSEVTEGVVGLLPKGYWLTVQQLSLRLSIRNLGSQGKWDVCSLDLIMFQEIPILLNNLNQFQMYCSLMSTKKGKNRDFPSFLSSQTVDFMAIFLFFLAGVAGQFWRCVFLLVKVICLAYTFQKENEIKLLYVCSNDE